MGREEGEVGEVEGGKREGRGGREGRGESEGGGRHVNDS